MYSYRFFENKDCIYFPCHQGMEVLNCLFCFCPLYLRENCPGNPTYIENGGSKIKDCTNCMFPHRPENYDNIIRLLSDAGKVDGRQEPYELSQRQP